MSKRNGKIGEAKWVTTNHPKFVSPLNNEKSFKLTANEKFPPTQVSESLQEASGYNLNSSTTAEDQVMLKKQKVTDSGRVAVMKKYDIIESDEPKDKPKSIMEKFNELYK